MTEITTKITTKITNKIKKYIFKLLYKKDINGIYTRKIIEYFDLQKDDILMIDTFFISKIPETISISTNLYGKCLRSNNIIKKDSIIYETTSLIFDYSALKTETFTLLMIQNKINNILIHTISTDDHFASAPKDRTEFSGFDAFINHSCDPNCRYICNNSENNDENYNEDNGENYNEDDIMLAAIKDISTGEELTVDYALFEYDNSDEPMKCMCGSPNCRKIVKGFKFLDLKDKLKLIKYADSHVKHGFNKSIKNQEK